MDPLIRVHSIDICYFSNYAPFSGNKTLKYELMLWVSISLDPQ